MCWNPQFENTTRVAIVFLGQVCSLPWHPVSWKPKLPLTPGSTLTYMETINTPSLSLRFSIWSGNSLFSCLAMLGGDSRLEERERCPNKSQVPGAPKTTSWLHKLLCAWATLWEFLSFSTKVMTNINTMINKSCKQISVMNMNSYSLKAILISVLCILKPFPSVIPKRIFLKQSFLVF